VQDIVNAGFDAIDAVVTIASEAPREELEALHTKVLASSPVGHTLSSAVPINVSLA